ncbi:MAG: VWA domain-containing protein, partial [Chlorobi bacterium]|nr:VWA domain-containing protein [Chlorobiota bacterium]
MMKSQALRNTLALAGITALWIFWPGLLRAQPGITILGIDTLWYPEVLINLDITCGGEKRFDVQRPQLSLFENGARVSPFMFYCPPPEEECCLSVALVLDASGSINGPIFDSVKVAAETFVQGLNGDCDYATVVVFRGYVHTVVPWTNDVQRLINGIKGLFASGPGALYDGIGRGMEELIHKEGWECQAVVVISDNGFDNASTRYTLQSCIDTARANK